MKRKPPRRRSQWRLTLGFLLCLHAFAAQAWDWLPDDLQWNAGVGVAGAGYPAWRGASEAESLVLPLPTFSVWTPQAEIGSEGLEAQKRFGAHGLLRFSASGSLPVDSDASALRTDMPDLDPTVELGPALGWRSAQYGPWHWRAETLLRGVMSVDFEQPQWLGWTLQPRVALHWRSGVVSSQQAIRARVAVGPIWAQQKLHAYFYDVPAELATAQRPAFRSRGGYNGTRANFSLDWLQGRLLVSGYVGYDDLRGTAFADSPLRPEDQYWLIGSFMSWRFWGPPRPIDLES